MLSQTISLLGLEITVYQLLVVVAFIGLVLGYLLALTLNRKQQIEGGSGAAEQKERAASNVSFMKGINYILLEKHDQAIEELTRAVSVDTETVETYIALGNLFRRNGEIERAIRIRQSIILRPNLDRKTWIQALIDLGMDYRQGGFYERAVNTFEDALKDDPNIEEAYVQLIQLYEETRDWEKASQMRERLARLTGDRPLNILAHYQVEIGKTLVEKGRYAQAKAAFKRALALDPSCVDAYLHWGDMQVLEKKPKKAIATWKKIINVAPEAAYLTFGRLARAAGDMRDIKPVEGFLNECVSKDGNPLAHLALAKLLAGRGKIEKAVEELEITLKIDPDMLEARRELGLLLMDNGRDAEALAAFREFIDHLPGADAVFQCRTCGFGSKDLMWRCPQCYNWDGMALRRRKREIVKPMPERPSDVAADSIKKQDERADSGNNAEESEAADNTPN